ncbi:MAG: glycoside hydrolase family 18 protein [Sandaracinaceae bacterium]|nr:glycoside hydrolase family 18 protein [Sandaracinaceae bacterium]
MRRWISVVVIVGLVSGCEPMPGGEADSDGGGLPPPGSDGGAFAADAGEPSADAGDAPVDGGFEPGLDAGDRPPPPPPSDAWRVVGYFTAWGVYGRDFHVDDVDAARLTHINYAFANVSASGECVLGDPYADTERTYDGDAWDDPLRGSFRRLQLLKERHPHLRTLISVGGWTWSTHFSDVALTEESRRRFASSCVDFMARYGFDGVDIDWEYPVGGGLEGNGNRPEDRHNYTLLLEELRRQLDARGEADGQRYLLTIAAPAGPSIIEHLELAALGGILDWINLMAYDLNGAWSEQTAFNAPMHTYEGDRSPAGFEVDAAVRAYLDGGVPPDRLVLGVPFYGRSFAGATAGDGLGVAFSGAGEGTWERGVVDWDDIATNYLPRMTRRWHEAAQVPWLHDPTTGLFISYDDPESLRIKRDYARGLGLGGVMVWELSADDDASTLLQAVQ